MLSQVHQVFVYLNSVPVQVVFALVGKPTQVLGVDGTFENRSRNLHGSETEPVARQRHEFHHRDASQYSQIQNDFLNWLNFFVAAHHKVVKRIPGPTCDLEEFWESVKRLWPKIWMSELHFRVWCHKTQESYDAFGVAASLGLEECPAGLEPATSRSALEGAAITCAP